MGFGMDGENRAAITTQVTMMFYPREDGAMAEQWLDEAGNTGFYLVRGDWAVPEPPPMNSINLPHHSPLCPTYKVGIPLSVPEGDQRTTFIITSVLMRSVWNQLTPVWITPGMDREQVEHLLARTWETV